MSFHIPNCTSQIFDGGHIADRAEKAGNDVKFLSYRKAAHVAGVNCQLRVLLFCYSNKLGSRIYSFCMKVFLQV